jgi:hypothetical protein
MSTRFKLVFAVVLFALVTLIVFLVLRQREPDPIVQGKPLSHWLAAYQSGVDMKTRAKTDEIISETGTNAFPILLRMLRARDPALKRWLMQLARKQNLVRIHFIPAQERHHQAGAAFAQLGAAGRDAIPALIQIYDEDISSSSRFATISALGSIGPSASNAIPFLIRAATNTVMEVRLSTITALESIHVEPDLTVPALINSLSDQQSSVRYYATLVLGRLGPEAKQATPALTKLIQDPDRNVRQGAADALRKIGQSGPEPK